MPACPPRWRCRFALFPPQRRHMGVRAKPREYFYYVDLHGRLYLDEDAPTPRPKVFNIATCLKEPRFLDFFFRQMRVNNLEAGMAHRSRGYGHVSPCGRELNFVRAADTGVVFSRLEDNRLFYAPTLSVEYDMTALAVSEIGRTPTADLSCVLHCTQFTRDESAFPCAGRVYHPAPAHLGGCALLASALVGASREESLGMFVL